MAIFKLNRHVVLKVNQLGVKHRAAHRHAEHVGQRRIRRYRLEQHQATGVLVPPGQHFFVNIAHGQCAGDAVQLRHHRARALHTGHQPFDGQLFHGAIHRHAAHTKLQLQCRFTRHRIARTPDARGDLRFNKGFDLLVGGEMR